MGVGVDEKDVGGARGDTAGHRHRLGRGGALVEERRVGQVHAAQIADEGLEVEERLQPALADLGLVGRVGGVPSRVLEHVAGDDRRHHRAVVAHADERRERLVPLRQGSQLGRDLALAPGSGQGQRLVVADGRRHRFVDELVERGHTELGQQGSALRAVGADVAGRELSLPFELAERWTIGR